MSPEITFRHALDLPCGERLVVANIVDSICTLDDLSFDPDIHLPQVEKLVQLFDSKLHLSGNEAVYEDAITVGDYYVKKLRNNGYGELRFIYYENVENPKDTDMLSIPDMRILYAKDTREIKAVEQLRYIGPDYLFFGEVMKQEAIRVWPV